MKKYRVGFLAAFVCILALSAVYILHPNWEQIAWVLSAGGFIAGTVTVTYKYPVSGTTAPTLLQALGCNELNAVVNAVDSDTIITIVHNWKLPSADATSLFPFVSVIGASDSTGTLAPPFIVTYTDSSTVTINKPTTVGTQGTFNVTLLRPHSIIR